jgi:teichuronic acid biosynthesis glycosyltransferase TuaH
METNETLTITKESLHQLKGANIVIIGLQAWYTDIGSNCKSIAMELAKENTVLYINMPLDRNTIRQWGDDKNIQRHLDIVKNKKENLFQIQSNLWNYYPTEILESINWVPFSFLFSILNKRNNKLFAKAVRAAVKRMGFKDYILFNDNDIFRSFYLKDLLKPKLYIYYIRDNLTVVDYWKKHGKLIEPMHMAKADLVAANSIYLAEYGKQHNRNAYYIGQGCDINLFDASKQYGQPEDIKSIPHPVIGYVGAIFSLRIDEKVIQLIARSLPQFSVVLIGPEDDLFQKSSLHQQSNVYFLGKKPLSSLPSYISNFDVCINPQLINEVTIGNYPLKVDEYLAMGKPVVATKTHAMQIFGDDAYTAEKPDEYPELIKRAVQEDTEERIKRRISLAHSHTWKNSVEQLSLAIQNAIEH